MAYRFRFVCYHKDSEGLIVNVVRGPWHLTAEEAKEFGHHVPENCTCSPAVLHKRVIETKKIGEFI